MKKNKKSLNYILRINTPALEHPKHMVLSLIEMSQGCQTVTSSDILLVLLALHQHDAHIILFCQCLTFGVGGNKCYLFCDSEYFMRDQADKFSITASLYLPQFPWYCEFPPRQILTSLMRWCL